MIDLDGLRVRRLGGAAKAVGLAYLGAIVRRLMRIGLLFAMFLSGQSYADFAGKVIGVADGDTLTVLRNGKGVKVRLVEIDAPEKAQPWGEQSRRSLSELCYGKVARVSEKGVDRYDRTLGRLECDGVDANAAQVHRGMAWAFTRYLTDPMIKALEEQARLARRGLWTDAEPVPPWEWRQVHRSEKQGGRGR